MLPGNLFYEEYRAVALPELDTIDMKRLYRVEFIRDSRDIDSIINMDAEGFGKDTITPDIVKMAYRLNGLSVAVARGVSGEVVGYIDYYGLRESKMAALIDGSFLEQELSRGDILSIDEVRKSGKIYIGGMVIRRQAGAGRGRIAASLLQFGLNTVHDVILTEASHLEVYASAYGRNAVGILGRMGFSKISDAGQRRDRSNLYMNTFTRGDIRSAIGAMSFERVAVKARPTFGGEAETLCAGRDMRRAFSPCAPST